MGDLMDYFKIDAIDENRSIIILNDPNTSLIPDSFSIETFIN